MMGGRTSTLQRGAATGANLWMARATLHSQRLNKPSNWRQIYADILEMQEKVLNRIRVLMSLELIEIQHEVELTNVPVVVAQVERFRQRLSYWDSRIAELDGR
jgi:hypothetical protein